MVSSTVTASASPVRPMRVAVEGCGHGTLDAIYASVQKACEAKGWDHVDLVIIGGDFQAVRNKHDLNVTAMPAKYRDMADFHHYYSGTKSAPFLTIFVGGNHEASNHLFELYYGGWVAPSIYYLGAANVIQVGPLKIAGMSGIWKGYDYRKPHYERLPYSQDDMYSIYHVRELDVRKLLSYRSQVDIGISHDWPKGVEWLGDHDQLFKFKPFLRDDAESGKLGNTAAQKVMDRLRPPYWFSAHLHARYAALKVYTQDGDSSQKIAPNGRPHKMKHRTDNLPFHVSPDREQISAWNNFGSVAKAEEAAESAKLLEETRARREEAEQLGVTTTANYMLSETYKKVRLGDGFARDITSVSYSNGVSPQKGGSLPMPQLDGSCASLPLKRPRQPSSSPEGINHHGTRYTRLNEGQANTSENAPLVSNVIENPDAIDIEMSDDDTTSLTMADGLHNDTTQTNDLSQTSENTISSTTNGISSSIMLKSRGGPEDTAADGLQTIAGISTTPSDAAEPRYTEDQATSGVTDVYEGVDSQPDKVELPSNEVSDEMRAQLAALSSKFEEPPPVSAPLPRPENIKNETTRFLALSKCEDKQNFLQLLEIEPYEGDAQNFSQPIELTYVPEWLAIQRVFASELTLGGTPQDQVPEHRGDTFYQERIMEEEKWVQENVVEEGLLSVPQNFERTAPSYDPAIQKKNVTLESPLDPQNRQGQDITAELIVAIEVVEVDNEEDSREVVEAEAVEAVVEVELETKPETRI